MKALLPLLALTVLVSAQEIEILSAEEAQKIARKIATQFNAPADAPFAVEPDPENPSGIKGGQAGLLALPDKKFTTDTLTGTGKEVKAVGHLWMHKVVPAVNGAAPDPAKLRPVTFGEDEKKATAEVYYLGVTKTEAGALELGLYAKDKEPLVKVPLVKTDAPASKTPLALHGQKEGEHTGVLVVTIFGSYKADVPVTRPKE